MKFKNLCLLFTLSTIAVNLFAQSRPGEDYYIDQKGDTISGSIIKRSERHNNRGFALEDGSATLAPENVKEVHLEDGSKYLPREYKDSSNQSAFYFFKVVTEGELTILQLGNKALYFVDEDNNHLLREISAGSENSASGKVTYNKGILLHLLEDQPRIARSIEKRKDLSTSVVIKALKDYNQAQNPDPEITNNARSQFTFSIGPDLRFSSNSIRLGGGGMEHGSFSSDNALFPGISMEAHVPGTPERLKIVLDILLGHNQHYAFFKHDFTNNDVILTHNTLRTGLAVRNTFSTKSNWFYQLGPTARILLNPDVYWKVEKEVDNIVSTDVSETTTIGNNFYGYQLGVGRYFNFGKLNFALHANLNEDFTLWENYGSDQNRYRPRFRSIETGISAYF